MTAGKNKLKALGSDNEGKKNQKNPESILGKERKERMWQSLGKSGALKRSP